MAEVFGFTLVDGGSALNGTVVYSTARSSGSGARLTTAPNTAYRIVITQVDGTKVAELENAVLGTLHWELSGDHTFSFVLPSSDPKVVHLQVPAREVQVWRGKNLIWWGVMVRLSATAIGVTVQCVGLAWYFKNRVFGPLPIPSLMTNGDFENGTAGWTAQASPGGPTFAYWASTKSLAFIGTHSLRMTSNNANGTDIWTGRYFTYNVPSTNDRADIVTVVAWAYVEAFTGPAKNNRGLYVEVKDSTGTVSYSYAATQIIATTPKKTWIRFEVAVTVQPRAAAQRIYVRLYGIHGTIYWDAVSASADTRLGYKNVEQATILKGIVEHAQNPAVGKPTLNIGTSIPVTSVKRSREYVYYNHGNIREALDEFPTLDKGMEWDIEFTPTTRTFVAYYPRKGARRGNSVLELGRNLVDYTVDIDGEQTANSVSVVAAGEGSDREEAAAKDATTMGTLVLEKVYNATPGSAPQSLQAQADRGLKRYKSPVTIPQIVTHEGAGDLIGAVNVGDVVPVKIVHGFVNLNTDYRVIAMDLDPQKEQITYTINPAATSF